MRSGAKAPAMANPHDHLTALKELQDSIYREKVLRARAMTPEERFDAGFEITKEAFRRMLEGTMWQLSIDEVIRLLEPDIECGDQVQFDTLIWGRRHIGRAKEGPVYQVELFELFDDPFVLVQFQRRKRLCSSQLQHGAWLPIPEDVIVQKIRWGRSKDLDDARDGQGPETLDMPYIENWCSIHGTSVRLVEILESLPEL